MEQAVFQTISYSLLQKEIAAINNKEFGINILIDDPGFNVATIFNYSKRLKADFIFSLSNALVNKPGFEALYGKLFSLFSVSAFAGSPVIHLPILNVGCANTENDNLEKLQSFFKAQGEDLEIIRSDFSTNIINKLLFLYEGEFSTLPAGQLTTYYKRDIDLILLLPKYIEEDRGCAFQDFIQANNEKLEFLFSKAAVARKLEVTQHQTQLWQSRAQLYLSFLTLSKEIGQDEYYGIKHWYHKEYEVLPLWYKKFGHVIKAWQGNRSWRSLINKDK